MKSIEKKEREKIEYYKNLGVFSKLQLTRIYIGLIYEIDVNTYAKPEIDAEEMNEKILEILNDKDKKGE